MQKQAVENRPPSNAPMRFLSVLTALLICHAGYAQKNAVKTTFLSWFTGSSKIVYERAIISPSPMSSEVALVMVGAGYDKFKNKPLGVSLRYGHKFFLAWNEDSHPLRGFFLRPEAVWTDYKYNSAEMADTRKTANMLALLATTGVQWDFKHFLIEGWIGGGYALGTPPETGYMHGFLLWKMFGTYNPNIALSFSIRLGYCF